MNPANRWVYSPAWIEYRRFLMATINVAYEHYAREFPGSPVVASFPNESFRIAERLTLFAPRRIPRTRDGKYHTSN